MNASKTTAAVLGARGMLGSELCAELARAGYVVKAFDLPELDIADAGALESALEGADIAANCAAYTNVDAAEREKERAFAVNAEAPGRLGRMAKRLGVFVLHVSTDFVFDGTFSRPYTEQDVPRPLNVYGASKWRGEQELAAASCECCIMRVQWSYGRNGSNFVTKLLRLASERAELKVVNDQVGAPTWTREMAGAARLLLERRCCGTYHFAAAGWASRYETALFIARQTGLKTKISPCSSSEFQQAAERPKNSRFDTSKIRSALNIKIRPWEEALAEFLAEYEGKKTP